MKKIYSIVLVMIMSCSLMLAGCSKSEDKAEKEITVYTSIESEFLQEYIDEFNEKYPDIKVNVVRDSTGIITAKLLAEKDNAQADVIWGVAASSLLVLDNENVLEGYLPKGFEKISEKFKDTRNEISRWTGISAWVGVFTVNKEELKNRGIATPKSYADLLKDKYKDEIVMPNPGSSGTGFLMVSAWIQMFGEEKAWEYMDDLNENMKMYVHSGSAPSKSTASGEQCIGLGMGFSSLRLQKESPQIDTIFPKEGLGWEMEAVALIKKENIKSEAKVFIDWAISEDAMKLYANNRGLVTLDGYESKLEGYPESVVEKLIENDFNWAAENRERIIKEWNRRYGSEK